MNIASTEPPFALHAAIVPDAFPDTVGESGVRRDALSYEHFKDLIGCKIDIVGANASTPFVLTEATEKHKSQYPGQKRMPFSLVLCGPLHITLDGHHYDLRHPHLGLIPYVMLSRTVAYPDQPPGAYYEIMFN